MVDKKIGDMSGNEVANLIKDALQPKFDEIKDDMVTKEQFISVFNAQADKLGQWFEAYGVALKQSHDELKGMIEDLKK